MERTRVADRQISPSAMFGRRSPRMRPARLSKKSMGGKISNVEGA